MKLSTVIRKKFRVRNKLKNVASQDRFRLSISRSAKNISAQIIYDKKILLFYLHLQLIKKLKVEKSWIKLNYQK